MSFFLFFFLLSFVNSILHRSVADKSSLVVCVRATKAHDDFLPLIPGRGSSAEQSRAAPLLMEGGRGGRMDLQTETDRARLGDAEKERERAMETGGGM